LVGMGFTEPFLVASHDVSQDYAWTNSVSCVGQAGTQLYKAEAMIVARTGTAALKNIADSLYGRVRLMLKRCVSVVPNS
jgi:hypothetical protein